MTNALRMAACGLTLAAIAGCAGGPGGAPITSGLAEKAGTPGFVPGVPRGYQCPLIPSGFDPVGSIYRLDKGGTFFRVKDFSRDKSVLPDDGVTTDIPIGNYTLSDKQTASAGLSFELLQKTLPGLTADANADFKKEIGINIQVEDLRGESIDDVAADRIVAWFRANVQPVAGSSYYIVRETVKAGAISYALKRDDVAKLGGQAQMETIAKGSANVTLKDNSGAIEIKQTFTPNRITVCVKPAEIVVARAPGAAGGAAQVSLRSADDTRAPMIKRIGRN